MNIESGTAQKRPLKVLLIDNQGGKGPELIKERLLPDHAVDVVKVWKLTPETFDDHELVVLSGGTRAKANTAQPTYRHELDLIRNTVIPVFGICIGMQLIVRAFEGKIQKMEQARRSLIQVETAEDNPLTADIGEITVFQSHRQAVANTPYALQTLGTSVDGIEIVRHREKPIVGVQFHPEKDGDFPTNGRIIFDRFMEQVVYS